MSILQGAGRCQQGVAYWTAWHMRSDLLVLPVPNVSVSSGSPISPSDRSDFNNVA